MKLKKFFALALAAATLALALTGCGSKAGDSADNSDANTDNQTGETVTVKLGVVGGIYDDLWASAKAALADEGIDLEIVQFSDYVTPNNALANGDIDLNAFQHRIYLQSEIESYGYAIQNIGNTFIIPLNLYSQKVSSVDELKDGDIVAIPDDLTNGGRALKVLEAAGLIELDPNAAFNPTVDDITSCKVNITIEELKANTIPSVLPDVAAAVVNGNYALDFGLKTDEAIYKDSVLDVEEYPNIMRVGTFERIGHHAVLITIPGSDASLRPCLYMSHQDVVPVVEGTEQDWTHPAFSGDIADGYIWGRGTLDIKEQVFGVLEAAEYLLARGKSFARTAYLAFGDDEETINLGALAIAEHLKAQGVTLEFVLDEGGCKIEPGTAFGAPETSIVSVQLMEKGYADLELSVHSIGGHSSRPYGGTSLGRLSGAIADITRAPFAVRLNSAMTGAFETLAPYITQEPLKTLVQDVAGNADAIAACCMGSPDLFPFVTTTIAPTMIRGGSAACNVMPQDMTAVINFRIADGDSTESVMAHCREAVQDKGVEMYFLQANDPSAIARRDGYGYRTVVESFQRYYPEAVFIPSMAVGATDAHRYEEICDTCLRCSPFMTEPAEAASGVHGTNERLLVRSYLQGIRVLIDLMEHANVEP